MTRWSVTPFRGRKWYSLGKKWCLGRLMLWRKMRHIFQKGDRRTANLAHSWRNTKTRITDMRVFVLQRSKVKLQGHVVSLVYVCQLLDSEKSQKHQYWQDCHHATADIPRQFQGQNSKGQRSRPPLNAVIENRYIFGMGRPTNFRLGIRMEYGDPH